MRQQYNVDVNSKQMGKIIIEKELLALARLQKGSPNGEAKYTSMKKKFGEIWSQRTKVRVKSPIFMGEEGRAIREQIKEGLWVPGNIHYLDWDGGYTSLNNSPSSILKICVLLLSVYFTLNFSLNVKNLNIPLLHRVIQTNLRIFVGFYEKATKRNLFNVTLRHVIESDTCCCGDISSYEVLL